MPELSNDDLLRGIQEEMLLLRQEEVGVRLEISPEMAFAACAMLQLALRHPEAAAGPSAALVRDVIQIIAKKFAPFPAIYEAIRRGDLREYDYVMPPE